MGEEITSLDCSNDGKWILATCDNYLLIIPTFSEGINGYSKNLGK